MADVGQWKGGSWKQEEDYTAETKELLERINAETAPVLLRASDKSVDELLNELLVLEKKARLGGDTTNTTLLAVEILKVLRSVGKVDDVLQKLEYLMKRRAQMKQVQTAMVAEASEVLRDVTDAQERRSVLSRLVFVTEGKIHLELEHARFTYQLAQILEKESKQEAVDMLEKLQVETVANMPRDEKINIVLEMLRLHLDLNDLQRIPSVSRKLNHRSLSKPDTKELKLRYFELMMEHFKRLQQPFMLARCAYEIYITLLGKPVEAEKEPTTGSAASNAEGVTSGRGKEESSGTPEPVLSAVANDKALEALSNCAVLVMISEHLSEADIDSQAECCAFAPDTLFTSRNLWLHDLEKNKKLEHELPMIHDLVKRFNSPDLIRDEVHTEVMQLGQSHPMLVSNPTLQKELFKRLSEHDLLVVARSFSNIRLSRLAELVHLTMEECEQFIMSMVNAKALFAKIDRIDGVVIFERAKLPAEDVEEWNKNIGRIMNLIDHAAHLVVKERMVHGFRYGDRGQRS